MAGFSWNSKKELNNVHYTSPWDARCLLFPAPPPLSPLRSMIQGCVCHRAITVDNQYDVQYALLIGESKFNKTLTNYTLEHYSPAYLRKFYRGPYAFTATNFKGYSCGQNLCPTGDSPYNVKGVNELQAFTCHGTTGSFSLTFRENTTLPIPANATVTELKHRLEQLFT
jgi:hypothetical protein